MMTAPHVCHESRAALRDHAIIGALLVVFATLAYGFTMSWRADIPRDGTGLVVGRDFLNFWMYGRTAWTTDPGRFYDLATYQEALNALLGAGYPGQNWSYPPSIFFLAAPFGVLSYLQALGVWTAATGLLFYSVLRQHTSDRLVLIALICAPATLLCLMSGQSSLVTAIMLLTIFAWLDRRPVAAGILIGLLTLKPQLGLLFPVLLAASGRWRVFTVAAATAIGLVGLTAAVFGADVWVDFVTKALPVNNLVLADANRIATPFYPTIFMNLRGIDVPYSASMAMQACVSIPAIAAVAWAFRTRRDADPLVLMALFLACSVAVVPYMLSYDTLALSIAALLLLAAGGLDAIGRRLVQLVYLLPMLQLALGSQHIPGPALVAPAFALFLVLQLNPAWARHGQARLAH